MDGSGPHPLRTVRSRHSPSRGLASIYLVAVGAAPEDLCGGAGAGPDHGVEVDVIGLFGPQVDFAAEDEVGGVGGHAGEGVVAVDESPVLGGGAGVVVGEGVVGGGGGGGGVEIEPLAVAAVQVSGVVVSGEGLVAADDGLGDSDVAFRFA